MCVTAAARGALACGGLGALRLRRLGPHTRRARGAAAAHLEVARAEGYEDGVAAATLAAREDMERDRAMMTALAAELKAGGAIDRAALAAADPCAAMLHPARLHICP